MATITDIQNGALHHAYRGFYGSTYDTDDQDRRYLALAEEHLRLFKERDFSLFSTAGRSELGGNHTDHNLGRVIAATINLDTIAAVSGEATTPSPSSAKGIQRWRSISPPLRRWTGKNTTEALVRGTPSPSERGLAIGGWQANTSSRVLKGSGLSPRRQSRCSVRRSSTTSSTMMPSPRSTCHHRQVRREPLLRQAQRPHGSACLRLRRHRGHRLRR